MGRWAVGHGSAVRVQRVNACAGARWVGIAARPPLAPAGSHGAAARWTVHSQSHACVLRLPLPRSLPQGQEGAHAGAAGGEEAEEEGGVCGVVSAPTRRRSQPAARARGAAPHRRSMHALRCCRLVNLPSRGTHASEGQVRGRVHPGSDDASPRTAALTPHRLEAMRPARHQRPPTGCASHLPLGRSPSACHQAPGRAVEQQQRTGGCACAVPQYVCWCPELLCLRATQCSTCREPAAAPAGPGRA